MDLGGRRCPGANDMRSGDHRRSPFLDGRLDGLIRFRVSLRTKAVITALRAMRHPKSRSELPRGGDLASNMPD
jgi:hypothetical protein